MVKEEREKEVKGEDKEDIPRQMGEEKEEVEKLLAHMDTILDRAMDVVENRDIDGIRLVEYKEDGVYLTVHPPQGKGKKIDLRDLEKEIAERRIKDVDREAVRQAVAAMDGKPVKIAPPQPEVVEDGHVQVEISKDKMKAYLTVFPPRGGKPVTVEEALAALREAGVVYGIKEDVVAKAVELANVSEPFLVAEGKPVENGLNARIEYKFNVDPKAGKPRILEDGRVDYYNLDLINNVREGDILAIKIPPTPGTPGMTVTGEEIPPKPGKDVVLAGGKNTELVDGGSTLIATATGHAMLQGNKVIVSPVLEVNGDVDFSSGNIDFVGSVLIKGSVKEGFRVKAEGDVEIKGNINASFVEAGGRVKVDNGIQGQSRGKVVAGGDVITKYIENAEVISGGSVIVGEGIMHSIVFARHRVEVGGRKGVIVGGLVRAGDEIKAKMIGSSLATVTELEVGVDPELLQQYDELKAALKNKNNDMDKAQKAIKLLKHLQETQGGLDPDKKALLVKLTRTQFHLAREIEEITTKLKEIEEMLKNTQRGRVMVAGVVRPGVKIAIGSSVFYVRDEIQYVCFTREGEEIKISPYQ